MQCEKLRVLFISFLLVVLFYPVSGQCAPAVPEVEIVYPMEGDEFTTTAGSVPVNISYSIEKGTVHTVKLQLDGNDHAAEAVHQKAGVVTFSLDLNKLSEGEHKLLAVAYLGAQPADHDGKSLEVRIKVIKEETVQEPQTDEEETIGDEQGETQEDVTGNQDQQGQVEDDQTPQGDQGTGQQDQGGQQNETGGQDDTGVAQDENGQSDVTPGDGETATSGGDTEQNQDGATTGADTQQPGGDTQQGETPQTPTGDTATGQNGGQPPSGQQTDTGQVTQPPGAGTQPPSWDETDTILIPTKPPSLKITSPKTGLLTSAASVTVEGKTDKNAEVLVLGEEASVKSDGTFFIKIDLDEGPNVLPIQAIGKNGLVTSDTLNVISDRTPPRLSLVSDDFQNTNIIPTIMVMVEEEYGLSERSLQSSLSRTSARQSASLNGNLITITPPADSKDGLYNISVSVSDAAGNTASLDDISFVLDRKTPEISGLSLRDGDVIPLPEAEKSFNITGKVVDPAGGAGIDKDETRISINGDDVNAKVDELTGAFEFNLGEAEPGAKVLVIESQDKAGNVMPPYTLTFTVGTSDGETIVKTVMDELKGEETRSESGAMKIIFTLPENGDYELYALESGGAKPARLTETPGYNVTPSYNAASRKIAFASTRDGNSEIYVMNEDGTDQIRLTENSAYDAAPAFSPDGKRLAFVSDRDDGYGIYILDLDTRSVKKITGGPGVSELPSFSPDGKKIAYASNTSGDFDIYLYDIETGEKINLTERQKELDSYPVFSVDGGSLYYISNRESGSDVYRIDIESGRTERITSDGNQKSNLAVGRGEILFTSKGDGGYKISRIELSTGTGGQSLASNFLGLYPAILER